MTPSTVTPAPWVPFTRAGCDVGDVATANQELENTTPDIADAFGANSPEAQQLAADKDSFKDAETADYVGLGRALRPGQRVLLHRQGDQVRPEQPVADRGDRLAAAGAGRVQRVPGAVRAPVRRAAARRGHREPVQPRVQVTNAAGNLIDENGNQINGAFLTNHPGFPGFGPINASQTLAYMGDLLESGVSVVNGYIADVHGNEHIPGLTACASAPSALGSGTACYIAQAQYYNDRVRHVLPAAGRRRHHRGQHGVRAQLGRGRPRGRRQRRPDHPAHARPTATA